ncbi:MAG: NAD(P)-binding domain-containing protein [Leifsonia sp.]
MTMLDVASTAHRSSVLADLPVAIIGAGPIGLAAAAHLVERGIDFMIFEKGDSIASSMAAWGHIRLFSPWEHLVDPAAKRLLEATGWRQAPAGVAPFASDLIGDYLSPLAGLESIRTRMRTGVTVEAVSRSGMDRTRSVGRGDTPFVLRLREGSGVSEVVARAVIDASGTYGNPNPLGSNGLDPIGHEAVADRISHALPDVLGVDRRRFAGKHAVVVGAGHSAANTLVGLARLAREEPGTTVTWVIRNRSAARVSAADGDELAGRASLGRQVELLVESGAIKRVDRFEITRLSAAGDGLDIVGSRGDSDHAIRADIVVNATGFRPDIDMLREIRLELDDIVEAPRRLAPLIDPNLHSCGTVAPHGVAELQQPESGFFIVGMKSYGRAPTFLLATGYEQVRSITAWLDGDVIAAGNVELVLPATGVCSTSETTSSCCS